MSAIRSRGNRETEIRLARLLRRNGIAGWRRHRNLPGRPDFAFSRGRVALFVDGCFWHCCPQHGRRPSSNQSYWLPKLEMNKSRDQRVDRELRIRGWKVVRVWEHELIEEDRLVKRIAGILSANVS
jgi:DNA mismatch endonuclease (patch repair protein)